MTIKVAFVDTFDGMPQFFSDELTALTTYGYDFEVDQDNPNIVFFGDGNFGMSNRLPQYTKEGVIRIFYTGENVRPSDCHYALSFDHFDTDNHMRLPLWVLNLHYLNTRFNTDSTKFIFEGKRLQSDKHPFKRDFCGYVQSNPRNQKRNELFLKISGEKMIDSAGPHFNNTGFTIPRGEDGVIQKMQWLNNYQFSLAIENGQFPGYITEKLLEAWVAGTVPIYWGSETVPIDFNPKAFINWHDFGDDEMFIQHILLASEQTNLYMKYYNEPLFDQERLDHYDKMMNKLHYFLLKIIRNHF